MTLIHQSRCVEIEGEKISFYRLSPRGRGKTPARPPIKATREELKQLAVDWLQRCVLRELN